MPRVRQFRVWMRDLENPQCLLIVAFPLQDLSQIKTKFSVGRLEENCSLEVALQDLSQIKTKFSVGRLEENCSLEVLDSRILLPQFRIHLGQSRLVIRNRRRNPDGLL